MKVLYLTNIPSPYRVDFFNEIGKRCSLTVLFERDSAKSRNDLWRAENCENFRSVILKGKKIGEAEAICPEVIKYLAETKYEVIIVGMYSSPTGMIAIEYLRKKRIPYILSTDGGMIKNDTGIKYKIKRHFVSSARYWLSTGSLTTEYLTYYGAIKCNIYKYPFTSIKCRDILLQPLDMNEKNKYRDKLGMAENKIIISVGQFIYRKGYDILINACKGLDKNVGVYIIGGKATDEYISLKNKYGLDNFHFVDFMTKELLADYYKSGDIFVLPTREDIWGLVVNEAMSYGLPVITTDKCVAGTEMIKNGENGYVVTKNCEYSKLIEKMLNDEETLHNMQIESLNMARKYTIEEMSNVHMEVFEKFILETN